MSQLKGATRCTPLPHLISKGVEQQMEKTVEGKNEENPAGLPG